MLDKHPPLKTLKLRAKERPKWLTHLIRGQLDRKRKHEVPWRQNRTPDSWKIFKQERNMYNKMLYMSRQTELLTQIEAWGKDTKKLYSLVNKLTNRVKTNPLPMKENPEQLCNNFAEYFMTKVVNIIKALSGHPVYNPPDGHIPPLEQFVEVSEDYVMRMIKSMPTKSCELDTIPTNVLKQCLDILVPPITKLVNLSLTSGSFPYDWKVTKVHPC